MHRQHRSGASLPFLKRRYSGTRAHVRKKKYRSIGRGGGGGGRGGGLFGGRINGGINSKRGGDLGGGLSVGLGRGRGLGGGLGGDLLLFAFALLGGHGLRETERANS